MEHPVLHNHVSLAVLPLQVLATDTTVEIFCQGLVMDLITDLSRFRSIHLIAHDTTKGFQPTTPSDSPTLEALNLDYVVKGLARHIKDKLIFNLQLVNVRQNRLVWAEKFTGGFDELFQIQEEVAEKIVVSLQRFVDHDVLHDTHTKPLTSLGAYECWLRGYQELKKGTFEADEQARTYFQQAIDLDPHYPRAYTGMSLSFFNEWSCQLWSRWEISQTGAFEWAQKALELDEWDHVSNAILGRLHLFNGAYEIAEHYLRKSLRINPNDAETLIVIAVGFTYLGYLKEAHSLYERARRLNPVRSFAQTGSFILFEMGEIEAASALAEKHNVGSGWVDFPAYQAAAFYLQGDLEQMQGQWDAYLDSFSEKINGGQRADSQTALRWMMDVNPYRATTQLQPFWEYMSEADLATLPTATPEEASVSNRFTQQAGLWTVAYDGTVVQLPDRKGYHDLARLLAQPNTPIHCTALMGAAVLEKGEAVFDDHAKAAYQQRIRTLQEDIAEAEARHDSERLATLQEEYEQVLDHLTQAVGKGGQTRKIAGSVEKSRSAVTWRIRSAIKKIADAHPALATHLKAAIKTGVFCEYAPEHRTNWEV